MYNSSVWNKLCAQLDVYRRKLCIQLIVKKKNIRTSYSSISSVNKLYAKVLHESNLHLKIM
jgi:hypothetical protein